MNCYKTVFCRFFGSITAALLLIFLSNTAFAQIRPISAELNFNNYIAVSNANDITALKRPRIVGEPKSEAAKNVYEATNIAISLTTLALQLEHQAFDLLNMNRAQQGLPPLVWSDDMARVARGHSQEMAQYRFFSHAGRNGSLVDARADLLGFKKWKAIGENIAYNRGFDKPAEFACERWMKSPSHRENILNPRWKEAGIGVAITADGTYYFTEVFISR